MSAEVTAYLDGLELLHGAVYRGVEDQRRLTMEHDAIPGLIAAVRGVLALHVADGSTNPWCDHDGFSWPCPTVAAVTAALSVTEPTQ